MSSSYGLTAHNAGSPANVGQVVHHCHFDTSAPSGSFTHYDTVVGPTISSLRAPSATAKYGANAMGSPGVHALSLGGLSFNTSLFTAELYYRPVDLSTRAGLMMHGDITASDGYNIQLYVTTYGALRATYRNGFDGDGNEVFLWDAFSSNGLIDPVRDGIIWRETALVVDTGVVRIYLDGEEVASDIFTPVPWLGQTDHTLAKSDAFGVTEYANGNIDEYRLTTNAALYREDYTPHVAPF